MNSRNLLFRLLLPSCLVLIMFFNHSFSMPETEHNPGQSCLSCHGEDYKLAGTVFNGPEADNPISGISISLVSDSGNIITINPTDENGNFHESVLPAGNYIIVAGNDKSRTWHNLPLQADCNSCHIKDGNTSENRTFILPPRVLSGWPQKKF